MPLPLQFRDCKAWCNPQVICPTGNLLTRVSSPLLKKIRFVADPNQFYKPRVPSRKRGVGHRHERWVRDRWTRQRWCADVVAGRASACERSRRTDERR